MFLIFRHRLSKYYELRPSLRYSNDEKVFIKRAKVHTSSLSQHWPWWWCHDAAPLSAWVVFRWPESTTCRPSEKCLSCGFLVHIVESTKKTLSNFTLTLAWSVTLPIIFGLRPIYIISVWVHTWVCNHLSYRWLSLKLRHLKSMSETTWLSRVTLSCPLQAANVMKNGWETFIRNRSSKC